MSAVSLDPAPPDPFAPRANPDLIGHEQAEQTLLAANAAGRMPHAVILAGPRGIGKATLAFRFARWLLARGAGVSLFGALPDADLALSPEHPVARRVAASGHSDLLTIERGFDPRTKKRRGQIIVDDIREIAQFLHLTAAEGGWRIVLIDSADEMNRNAANALLKVLEEPPRNALLLLVCHAPGQLLPTIRSRCRIITLQPLAEDAVVRLLRQHRPALGAADMDALARMAEGSIGRALDLADADGLALYRDLTGLLGGLAGGGLDAVALHHLADRLARGGAEDLAYPTFIGLLLDFLARLVTGAAEGQPREILAGDADLLAGLADLARLDQWIELWENLHALFERGEAVHLDRKQMVLDAFFTLAALCRS